MDTGKNDYEGFLSPLVIEAFGRYMHICRMTPTGLRASDNWQLGIPVKVYMKSMWRHFFDVWSSYRGGRTKERQIINLLALKFNVDGMLHEALKHASYDEIDYALGLFTEHRAEELAARMRQQPSPTQSPPRPQSPGPAV